MPVNYVVCSDVLETSTAPMDMDSPGYRLHPLTGSYDGFYAVEISGNWRLVFRFEGQNATDVDYVDYH